jgi:hypothetical protein
MAICHLVAGVLAASSILPGRHPGSFTLNWAIPIVLILWAVRRTERIADEDVDSVA